MFPLESYQRYSYTKVLDTDEIENLPIKINGRGAMGFLFQGQKNSDFFLWN